MAQPMSPATDDDLESQLQDLCASLSDNDLHELGALAEAMHAEGGQQ